jgi:hypothetical protein
MKPKFKKIDAIIIVILLVIAGLFLYKSGYIELFPPEKPVPPSGPENVTPLPPEPLPPSSFTPSYRRDVSPEDEGVHYDKIRICREWWYYSAVFDEEDSELKDWVVAISFNHMARSDLLGTGKPDLLVVTLLGPNGETYGGMINKERGLGILKAGTLIASSPGVKVEFEASWAEGAYPNWHVHAEDTDIDKNHDVVVDLDYTANSLPVWTIGNRAFDKSKSVIANYLFTGCNVTGTVTLDGKQYTVHGLGYHEHAWTPTIVTRGLINGWDWFHMTLENGWNIYASNYYPMPQVLSSVTSRINPYGVVIITTDKGKSLTELRNVDLKITKEDERIFPFVRMPSEFQFTAKPSLDPLYVISQSFLYGTNLKLAMDVGVENAYNKVWKFPTYVGMKVGMCSINGTLSWSDDDGDHVVSLDGLGVTWSMRALL